MMGFEEIQKVWNEQKGENMYVIDEAALHRSVTRKKNAVSRRINCVEIMLSVINSLILIFLLILMFSHPRIWGFMNIAIVATSVAYILYFRRKRKKEESRFDRSILGELDHAIFASGSIIRINYLMLGAYLAPMFAVAISSLIDTGASLEKWIFTTGMFVLSFFVVRWEQRACNVPRKKQLMVLKKKLMEE
jgi:hypothetical protein